MVGSPSPIQELRTRLEKSRWQLHDGLLQLETRLKDADTQPSQSVAPVSKEFTKWMLLGVVAGMVALELTRRLWQRRG